MPTSSRRRGRPSGRRPRLTLRQILKWAAAHYARTGRWPTVSSGPVQGARGDTWLNLDNALRLGWRGLPGGLSLARLTEAARLGCSDWPPPDPRTCAGEAKRLERDAAIRRDRAAGATFGELARKYGLTKQRAHQIIREGRW